MSETIPGPVPYVTRPQSQATQRAQIPVGVKVLRLGNNESPFGPSPKAIQRAQNRCNSLFIYPDPASADLRQKIAQIYNLSVDQITCGNGSEEIIDTVSRVYLRPGDEILAVENGFFLSGRLALRTGATRVSAPVGPDFEIDVDAILERLTPKTRIVFCANPENPTGRYVLKDKLLLLRDGLPDHVVLLIDAAYAEYVEDDTYISGVELVDESPNVIVTRTFSKAFGLAACRVGWAYCPKEMADSINTVRGICNVNAIAQEAACGALDDLDFMRSVVKQSNEQRARLHQAFKDMGYKPIPSGTNFILVEFADHDQQGTVYDHFIRQGIQISANDGYDLKNYLRFSIGLPEDNDRVISVLKEIVK